MLGFIGVCKDGQCAEFCSDLDFRISRRKAHLPPPKPLQDERILVAIKMAPKSRDTPTQGLKPSKASKPPMNGARSSTSKPKPPPKQFKSAEFIVDSDDEAADGESTPKLKEPKRKPVSGPKSAVVAEKKAGKFAKEAAKARETPSKRDPPRSRVNGVKSKDASDSSISSESESEKAIPARKRTTTKDSYSSSSEESTTSSGNESENEKARLKSGTAVAKEKRAESTVDPKKSSSEEQSASDSDNSGSDSSDDNSNATNNDATSPSHSLERKETHSSEIRPAQPFEPPEGFEEVDDVTCAAAISKLFHPSAVSGKQIWYITAPANVPISLDKIDLNHVAKGVPVIRHEGRDYGLAKETMSSRVQTSIMLPDDEDYEFVPSKITQIMHLQQVVRLPSAHASLSQTQPSQGSQDSDNELQRPKKEQPKGLRMRYKPSGYRGEEAGAVGSGSSDNEDILYAQTDTTPSLRQPPGPSLISEPLNHKKRKKRDDRTSEEPLPKKSKKDDCLDNGVAASLVKETKKTKLKHRDVVPDSFDTSTPFTMTALQTSNANGIVTTSSETIGTDARTDGMKEKKEKSKHLHRVQDGGLPSNSTSKTPSSSTQPAGGVDGQLVKKRKQDKEKSIITKDASPSKTVVQSKSAAPVGNGISAEKRSLANDLKDHQEKRKERRKKKADN